MMWLLTLFGCGEEHSLSTQIDTSNMVEIATEDTTYRMGYPDLDPGPYNNHWKAYSKPQHDVTVSAFYLDKTEVTVEDYVEMLNDLVDYPSTLERLVNPLMPLEYDAEASFTIKEGYENRPMNYVSWYEAAAYCAHIGKRLPFEAEWELAAKGADIANPRNVPWDTPGGWSCHKAVYYTNETLCAERPEPVGTHPDGDTPDGISDMAGNVSEWIFDWFAEYTEEAQTNPVGPDDGVYKILRGGGFRDSSDALRVNDRVLANPKSRSEGVGFRCAVSSSVLSNSSDGGAQ
jgi:formylglycine-generating enzyme required for sulfatase activity